MVTDGVSYSTYSIPDQVSGLLASRRISLVLVDGPAAEAGARYATVPGVRDLLDADAVILLDDALRDGELDTAKRWDDLDWIGVDGMYMTEKGLLRARAR